MYFPLSSLECVVSHVSVYKQIYFLNGYIIIIRTFIF